MIGIRKRILRSPLLWTAAVLLLCSSVFTASSLYNIIVYGAEDIAESVINSGIGGNDTINSYVILHIAVRLDAFLLSLAASAGILIGLIIPACGGSETSTLGIDWLSRLVKIIKAVILAASAFLIGLFAWRMIAFSIRCYAKRYNDDTVFMFFATVFGECLLGVLAAGVINLLYRFVKSSEDVLNSVHYCLVFDRQGSCGIAKSVPIAMFIFSVLCAVFSFTYRYDSAASIGFALLVPANALLGAFLLRLKFLTDEMTYIDYHNERLAKHKK